MEEADTTDPFEKHFDGEQRRNHGPNALQPLRKVESSFHELIRSSECYEWVCSKVYDGQAAANKDVGYHEAWKGKQRGAWPEGEGGNGEDTQTCEKGCLETHSGKDGVSGKR